MSQLNLDLLVRAHTEANVEQVTLAFVINYYSFAFIARRHHFDFLAGCYELPQGVMKDKESVLAATKRILQTHFGVELLSIDQYLHTFLYQSGNKKKV